MLLVVLVLLLVIFIVAVLAPVPVATKPTEVAEALTEETAAPVEVPEVVPAALTALSKGETAGIATLALMTAKEPS